jgi:hypothetical protein
MDGGDRARKESPSMAQTRTTAKGSRAARGAKSPTRGKNTKSRAKANSQGKQTSATPGKSLDHAQLALGQAAKTEKQLRASLKKHSKGVSTAKGDLKTMKSQLKTAKKSRKSATKKLSQTP